MGSHLGLPDAGLASYRDMVERAPRQRSVGPFEEGPKRSPNIRILHSDFKAQYEGDTRNHGL